MGGNVHRAAEAAVRLPVGDLLRQALELEQEVHALVESAVVAERERGTTWDQIGAAAGTTRQSAHGRWSASIGTWSRLGRAISGTKPTEEIVAFLDKRYALLEPERTNAVSAGLDATRHPGSTAYEESLRTRGRDLHARRTELSRGDRRLDKERKRLKDPSDRTGWLRLAANLTASADAQDAVARVYNELVTAEPALAEEHRASADTHRGYAQNARNYAELALEQAGKL
ncbi:hypothetical protein [Streptomyces sp. Wh19]|uniref:Uncharacterized protein n=1 Tax=Streptomyces sanglieri TaxID=193460 RepID=A0ABW2X662_9ACTN|nr:hypothetical protein [Streptomyces sp. Wh19]MDV9195257.1 hypothetical protein [Streptomyces sp. Wh19]